MKIRTYLIFGAPGSGKGTQGRVLGTIPGFFHLACGDVFRAPDLRSPVGKAFIDYSSRGHLVPDDITLAQWRMHLLNTITMGRFKPDIDHLVLDGIPRNVNQARLLEEDITVKKVFHLHCPDREALVERLRRRALKDNRFDDANDEIIRKRLETYELETRPVLDYYGPERTVKINAIHYPYEVLRSILEHVDTSDALAAG
jgi:adenylate kinase